MPLTTSCEALYFPPEAKDNILTLRWSNSEHFSLGPYSMILFKLKCSAPRLFHVVPRYGALPLLDGTGNETEEARHGVSVVIGLHGYVLKAREAAWHNSNSSNNNETNGNSPTPRPVSAGAVNLITASGIPIRLRPQEKFAIEYYLISGEHLAYQEMNKAIATSPAAITEEAEKLWALIVAGAIPHVHLLQQSSITLTAYTQNVILTSDNNSLNANTNNDSGSNNNNKDRSTSNRIVVPPHAQLIDVPPSRWQQASLSPRSITNRENDENVVNNYNNNFSSDNNHSDKNSIGRASVQTMYSPVTASERPSVLMNNNNIINNNSNNYNSNNRGNNVNGNNNSNNKDSTISAVFATSPTWKSTEELKALKEEIRTMRSEQTPSPGSGTPYYNSNSNNHSNNTNASSKTNSTRVLSPKRSTGSQSDTEQVTSTPVSSGKEQGNSLTPWPTTSSNNTKSRNISSSNNNSNNNNVKGNINNKNTQLLNSSKLSNNDISAKKKESMRRASALLMQVPATAHGPRQGNGLKLYMLLILMFVAYLFIIYLRRPTKSNIGVFAAPTTMTSYQTLSTSDNNGLAHTRKMLNSTEIHISR